MTSDLRGMLSVIVGSLTIALGSTLAGINAFDGEVTWVLLGFIIFVVGYVLSQHGLHASGGAFHVASLKSKSRASLVFQAILLTVGVIFIALGVTMFSQTILNVSLEAAVLSGISSIGGYMCAHVGINREGLGESLIYHPVQTLIDVVRERM
ncbi:MAG: hypothetical protein ABEH78_03355 [Haloferacaceae archaeon]